MARKYDIVVYGATGYTGRLVAEYLATTHAGSGLTWAMAGRSADKLAQVRDLIGASVDTPLPDIPLIVADSDDLGSLAAMAASTVALITTVGPYQLYGTDVLAACVAAGTHYADLCGEPVWMRQMIDRYDAEARASGARIAFSCGFDSIPFDLGVLMLQNEAWARHGVPAPRVKCRVRSMQGGFSGGTAASLKASLAAIAREPALGRIMASPFGLTPGFTGPDQPPGNAPMFDEATGSWAAPFVMAVINTKNVHRTNLLLGHRYGADLVYDEMLLTGAGDKGQAAAEYVAKTPMMGGPNDPLPGEGPTPEQREKGHYDLLFVGEWPDGRVLRYGVKGRYDPGYGSTSRMISETAIALTRSNAAGGIGTPGSILGTALVKRLQDHAEIAFAVED